MKPRSISQKLTIKRTNEDVSLVKTKTTKTTNERGQSILLVQGEDGQIRINLTDIHKNLEHLKLKAFAFVKTLDADDRRILEHITAVRNNLLGTGLVSHIDDIIRDVFKDIGSASNILPGTVVAHLNGCNLNTDFNGLPSCSAICAGSFNPEDGTMGWEPCRHPCFLYDGQNLDLLNEVTNNDNAYIFMAYHLPFSGFTDDMINKLKVHGVRKAKIVTYKDGGQYLDKDKDFVNLEDLPILGNKNKGVDLNKKQVRQTPQETNSTISWVILGIVIAVFIVILILVWWFYRGKSPNYQVTAPSYVSYATY